MTVVSYDLNNGAVVWAPVDGLGRSGTPLKGLMHSAVTIVDDLIANLDNAKMRDVLTPKVAGTWNPHQATRELALGFFMVYSLVTIFLDNPGQSSYVTANAFLKALIYQHRTQGLPGTHIAWGPPEDVGFFARNAQILGMLQARIGGRVITSARAMTAFEQVLQCGHVDGVLLWPD